MLDHKTDPGRYGSIAMRLIRLSTVIEPDEVPAIETERPGAGQGENSISHSKVRAVPTNPAPPLSDTSRTLWLSRGFGPIRASISRAISDDKDPGPAGIAVAQPTTACAATLSNRAHWARNIITLTEISRTTKAIGNETASSTDICPESEHPARRFIATLPTPSLHSLRSPTPT